jgi:hypothetical protein
VLAATPTSQQYSDRVTLTATITPSSVDGSTGRSSSGSAARTWEVP